MATPAPGVEPRLLIEAWLVEVAGGRLYDTPLAAAADPDGWPDWPGPPLRLDPAASRWLRRAVAARLAGDAPSFARAVGLVSGRPEAASAVEVVVAPLPTDGWAAAAAAALPGRALGALAELEGVAAAIAEPGALWRTALRHADVEGFALAVDGTGAALAEDVALAARALPAQLDELLDRLTAGDLPLAIDWREDAAARAARRAAARLVALAIASVAVAVLAAAGISAGAAWTPLAFTGVVLCWAGCLWLWRRC